MGSSEKAWRTSIVANPARTPTIYTALHRADSFCMRRTPAHFSTGNCCTACNCCNAYIVYVANCRTRIGDFFIRQLFCPLSLYIYPKVEREPHEKRHQNYSYDCCTCYFFCRLRFVRSWEQHKILLLLHRIYFVYVNTRFEDPLSSSSCSK